MYVVYPSIFSKEKEGYSVHFPDLGGATCGSDLEDAYYMATDYIGTVLMEDFLEKKELPKATEIKKNNPTHARHSGRAALESML